MAVRTARDNLAEARGLVAATGPSALARADADTLAAAVARQAERTAEETALAVRHATEGAPRRLPAEQEIVLLRAAQELLANAARHAGGTRADVRLAFGDGTVRLRVADDGVGFDPAAVGPGRFGLAMLRARSDGAGTTVAVEVPA